VHFANDARAHGFAVGQSSITLDAGATVMGEGYLHEHRSPAAHSLGRLLPEPEPGAVNLEPNQTQAKDPGAYAAGSIKSGAHLQLRSGTYTSTR